MVKKVFDKVKSYILNYAANDIEPLHLILAALIQKELISNARDAIRPILELMSDEYLECKYHSTWSRDEYKAVHSLSESQLAEYVNRHE